MVYISGVEVNNRFILGDFNSSIELSSINARLLKYVFERENECVGLL